MFARRHFEKPTSPADFKQRVVQLRSRGGWGVGDEVQISICSLLNDIYNIQELKFTYKDI